MVSEERFSEVVRQLCVANMQLLMALVAKRILTQDDVETFRQMAQNIVDEEFSRQQK